MELLIFVTALVKHFEFAPPAGKQKISFKTIPMLGYFHFPYPDEELAIKSRY